jgi:hypothetical protein
MLPHHSDHRQTPAIRNSFRNNFIQSAHTLTDYFMYGKMFENKALGRIFVSKRDEIGEWRNM